MEVAVLVGVFVRVKVELAGLLAVMVPVGLKVPVKRGV